jgi:hypothetical protein
MTFVEFAEKHKLGIDFDTFLSYIDGEGRQFFSVRINGQEFDYNQGSAIKGNPKLHDVLYCLASDIRSLETSSDFEGWATDFGYDPDSRKAEKIYHAIKEENAKLIKALGSEMLNELLNCEE